jgi:hypothetical protein
MTMCVLTHISGTGRAPQGWCTPTHISGTGPLRLCTGNVSRRGFTATGGGHSGIVSVQRVTIIPDAPVVKREAEEDWGLAVTVLKSPASYKEESGAKVRSKAYGLTVAAILPTSRWRSQLVSSW